MPNIAIINECNLKCPYCFADEMIDAPKKVKKYMTPEEFIEVLDFVAKNPGDDRRIGIIGGEPTLHPQIGQILTIARDFALQHDFHVVVFTNGILLDRIIPFITRDIFSVLVNVNSPDVIGMENYEKILDNLSFVYETFDWQDKVSVGINVYQEQTDYAYFADIIKRFHLKSARVSLVAPTYKDHAKDKELYYKKAKDLQMQVCRLIYHAGAAIRFDCNRVPDCYYTPDEKKELEGYVEHNNPVEYFCFGPVDITVDKKAVRCFGIYNPVDIADFDSYADVKKYILFHDDFTLYPLNQTGRCKACKKNKSMQCSGGCYVFARELLNMNHHK